MTFEKFPERLFVSVVFGSSCSDDEDDFVGLSRVMNHSVMLVRMSMLSVLCKQSGEDDLQEISRRFCFCGLSKSRIIVW